MGKGGYGVLEPVWFWGAALSSSLTDLLDTCDREEEAEEEGKTRKDEINFDDFSESDGER